MFEILTLTILFNLLALLIGGYAMYQGSTHTYLSAKNDMIERDLKRTVDIIHDIIAPDWFFDFCHEHPQEILDITQDERNEIALEYDEVFQMEEKEAEEFLKNAPFEVQVAFASENYTCIALATNSEQYFNKYDSMFCIDIREKGKAYVYHEADHYDKDGNITKKSAKLGDEWDYPSQYHEAIEKILDSNSDTIQYETVKKGKFKDHNCYIAYYPMIYDGEVMAVLCLDYNWDDFSAELIKQIRTFALLMLIGTVITSAILMWLINSIAIKPLSNVTSAVRGYMNDRDSTQARERLDQVSSKNEIGVLSDDIGEMTQSLDKYIKDLKDAKDDIQALSVEVMQALAQTIDAKDKYTNGHSTRVAEYSRLIAMKLGLSEQEQDEVYYIGLLHDIGKIGIPSSIINKPTRLTDEEYAMIKTHPKQGFDILSQIKSMPALSTGARWHHERFDGKGYPDGIAGEDIPLLARIIAVADSYDTMTSNRSYRKYLPQAVAREEIEKNIGSQFDPDCARAMLELIDEDKDYQMHEMQDLHEQN